MPKTIYEYKRIKTPVSDQKTLKEAGYTPVFSSNVSAIQRKLKDLYIRFHNGSIYKYPGQGKNFGDLLLSSSKGKWVWANLRKTNISFSKVGSMPLDGDLDLTDEQLFTELKERKIPVPVISHLLSSLVSKDVMFASIISKEAMISKGIIASSFANIIKGHVA